MLKNILQSRWFIQRDNRHYLTLLMTLLLNSIGLLSLCLWKFRVTRASTPIDTQLFITNSWNNVNKHESFTRTRIAQITQGLFPQTLRISTNYHGRFVHFSLIKSGISGKMISFHTLNTFVYFFVKHFSKGNRIIPNCLYLPWSSHSEMFQVIYLNFPPVKIIHHLHNHEVTHQVFSFVLSQFFEAMT